jgi:hypothetical protein
LALNGKNKSIDDELVTAAKRNKEAGMHDNANEVGKAFKNIKIWSAYIGVGMVVLCIVLILIHYIAKLNDPAVNAMGFSLIGAIVGALISHLLTKKL